MYGGNMLNTKLKNGTVVKLEQLTEYPWNGKITITIKENTIDPVQLHLRIPGWCKSYAVKINGRVPEVPSRKGADGYVVFGGRWSAGEKIELMLDMPVTLLESNPLVEATKNQVTVKRGPVVYCLESADLPQENIFNVLIPATIKLQSVPMKIDIGNVMALTGEAKILQSSNWKNTLYKEVSTATKPVKIKLIPYYAWANRGQTDMTVWMPVVR